MYMYYDVDRKWYRNHSWVIFLNEDDPLNYQFCMVKLTIGKLKRVTKRLRRALNISSGRLQQYVGGERSQDKKGLQIYFTGSTKQDIIWE